MADSRRPEVVAIFGPTASGKTAVAELVADALGTEVVSADALQVYRGIPIVTNQPERPTRLVGIRALSEEMSVGEFATLAHDAIDELVAGVGFAVVSGGTGLYLRAALQDLAIPPPPANGVREAVERLYDEDPGAAHVRLGRLDPQAAEAIHVNDRRRVVRALELNEAGHSLHPGGSELWSSTTRRPTVVVGLEVTPSVLEERIRARAAGMIGRGGADEARAALQGGISRTAEQALGLRELAELAPDVAVDRIVVRTRRYAAYQRKWMRRIPCVQLIDGDRTATDVAADVLALVRAE